MSITLRPIPSIWVTRLAVGSLAGACAIVCAACSSGAPASHSSNAGPVKTASGAVGRAAGAKAQDVGGYGVVDPGERVMLRIPGPTEATGPGSDGSLSPMQGEYNGTLTVDVTRYDYCSTGALQPSSTNSVSLDGSLDIVSPRSDGETTEPNPFGFVFQGGNLNESGSITLASALSVQAPTPDSEGNPNTVLTYWSIDQSSDQVQATLQNTWAQAGGVYNDIYLDKPLIPCESQFGTLGSFPYAIDSGTTLTGTVSGGHADLTITGRTTDQSATFTAHFVS